MKGRVEQLDGLRGVFAVMVIAHHHNAFKNSIFYNNFFVINSSLFVDFFFVLSGFVIAMNYLDKIDNLRDFGQFLKKRLIRLYPLLLFTELLFIAGSFLGDFTVMKQSANLPFEYYWLTARDTLTFMGSTPVFGGWMSNNYPAWSISAEMIAYAVFGLVVLFPFKNYLFGLIIVLSGAFIIHHGEYLLAYEFGFVRGLLCFFVGALTFVFLRGKKLNLTAFEWPFLIFLLLAMYVAHHAEFNLLKLVFPVIFSIGIVIFSSSQGMVTQMLLTKPVQFLGKISYSIYLNHAIVLIAVNVLLFRFLRLPSAEHWVGFSLFLSMGLTIVYSNYTYRYIEKGIGRFFTEKWK
jgi:peptidoglycan/LPS O-acetylase OafA/YrhL